MNNFDKFCKLIEGQFKYGGKKYAADNIRESTDILFDDFGYRFSLGTMAKYTKRYANLARERDLLKIACYCYIYFLKRGFHLYKDGLNKAIDTTVIMKEKHFKTFINIIKQCQYHIGYTEDRMEIIYNILKDLARPENKWINVQLTYLLTIFLLSFLEWDEKFSHLAGQDQDVNLITDNK